MQHKNTVLHGLNYWTYLHWGINGLVIQAPLRWQRVQQSCSQDCGVWDMTHSQSDWTHPLKTQQLSWTLWEIWCHFSWPPACCSLSLSGPTEASSSAALCCSTCLMSLKRHNSPMTSASAGVEVYRGRTGKINRLHFQIPLSQTVVSKGSVQCRVVSPVIFLLLFPI